MKRRIYLIGMGMGRPENMTTEARMALEHSQCIIGAKRLVDSLEGFTAPKIRAALTDEVCAAIAENPQFDPVSVVFSGDIGFYSGADALRKRMGEEYALIPLCGISSPVYFCGKLGLPWQDVHLVSAHGRQANPVGEVLCHERVLFLTGGRWRAQDICRELVNWELGQCKIWVGERLSYPEERITAGRAQELADREFDPLAVLLAQWEGTKPIKTVPGLPDEFFLRGSVPMTKSEVRSICLSKLRIAPGDIVYDIGAGTGSVAVECAIAAPMGFVYAVEKNPEGISLIRQNREKSGTWNLKAVEGTAPQALSGLPTPDKAFIGGSSGNLKEILTLLQEKNPEIRVVLTAITLETVGKALKALAELPFDEAEIVQIGVSKAKKAGNSHMMMGQNPVFVITAQGLAHP